MNPNGIAGSVLQQINHGISTGMLFLIIGVIYERRHTREISEYGGLAHVMPKFAIIFAIAMLSSAGLPLLNGFVGEFTILQGAFEANHIWAAFAVTGVILGAAYLLWLYQRTMLGQVTNGKNLHLPDLSLREVAVFLPLIAWAIWIGIYPKPYFDILEKPVQQIVERVHPGYYQGAAPAGATANELVLYQHRSLCPGARRDAGAVRLRHSAFRFRSVPRPAASQVSVVLPDSGRGFCRLWLVETADQPGGGRRPRSFPGSLVDGRLLHLLQLDLHRRYSDRGHRLVPLPGNRGRASRRVLRLMLFAQCGMFFLASGTDLVTLFIGLELMALSFYVMVGFLRTEQALQ